MLELPNFDQNFSYMRKFCWWRQGKKSWRHNFYFKIPFFQGLE